MEFCKNIPKTLQKGIDKNKEMVYIMIVQIKCLQRKCGVCSVGRVYCVYYVANGFA